MKLPGLPEEAGFVINVGGEDGWSVRDDGCLYEGRRVFTEEQMRAYGEAVREECARVAESLVDAEWPNDDQSIQAKEIAAAIRSKD